MEAMYFDSHVRTDHYTDLQDKLTAAVSEPFKSQLSLLAAQQLSSFDKDFKLALLDKSTGGFSAVAEKVAAEALAAFDSQAQNFLVPGTTLSGEQQQQVCRITSCVHTCDSPPSSLYFYRLVTALTSIYAQMPRSVAVRVTAALF